MSKSIKTPERFSLINVSEEKDGLVDGVWIQDFHGSLENAILFSEETEKVNGNRIKVAVVEWLGFYTPDYNLKKSLVKLN